MSVYRIYVEKKPEFAVEANSLISGIKSALGLDNLTGLRVINRYDAEGLSREDFDLAAPVVFSGEACRLFRCRCGIDMHTKNTAALVHFPKCKSSGILLHRFRFLLQRFVHIPHQNQDHQQVIRKNRDRGVVCDHTEQRRHQAVANIGAGHLNPNDRL